MSKAFIVSSGSEAMEAAIKLSRQFFLEQTPAQRTRYRGQASHETDALQYVHLLQSLLSERACAAALEVQRIVVSDNLLENVRDKGSRLSRQLRSNLDSHAHVGDIRGKGLFWGVEFVFDRRTKDPFPRHAQIAARLSDLALTEPYGITVYPGAGTVDGYSGDHIILAPPYTITDSDVDLLVESVTKLIRHFFHYEINLPEKSRDS
ncbi:putative aminotransferase like protein [Verticillium longisporum]|nr:putative aminotransferase like protein [Verticillium longisporum]